MPKSRPTEDDLRAALRQQRPRGFEILGLFFVLLCAGAGALGVFLLVGSQLSRQKIMLIVVGALTGLVVGTLAFQFLRKLIRRHGPSDQQAPPPGGDDRTRDN